MDFRTTILMLRVIACIVVMAALGGFVGSLHSIPDLNLFSMLSPLALLAAGVGIGAGLFGLAAVMQQRQKSAPSQTAGEPVTQSQMIELSMKMEDLALSIDRLSHPREPAPSSAVQPPPAEPSNGATPDVLIALQRLFEELRDVSLLPDEQRRQRWQEMQEQRKQQAIRNVSSLIQNRQWGDAQSAINALQNQFPDDPAVQAVLKQLESARAIVQAEALELSHAKVESEMSLSHWDQALALAQAAASDFPTSSAAQKLLNRVEREREIYTETTVQRLYDEIRHDVERRIWRRALAHAQKLLEKFPDHPRSELVRKQIKTIQDNAEIEERQEQEMRIGELIRSRRFHEAVHLSEELLRQFPNSPQAEAIEKLLPRIQQLAAEADAKSPQSSTA
jgi:tetratricopeptide (TPR) repeat protein